VRLFRRSTHTEAKLPVQPHAKRVLVVGSAGHSRVRCVRWDERDFPNVADHDAIIVNTVPLAAIIKNLPPDASNELWKRVSDNQASVRQGALKALGAGKTVYAIDVAELFGNRQKREGLPCSSGGMWNRAWAPVWVRQVSEQGETLEVMDDVYRNFLRYASRWDHLYQVEQMSQEHSSWFLQAMLGHDPDCFIAIQHAPVARNCYGRIVALKLRVALHRAVEREFGGRDVSPEPMFRSGEFVLLPAPTECSDRDAVNVLLEDFFSIPRESMPPEWTDEVKLPGEDAFIREDEKHAASIQELSRKRERIAKGISDLREYKRLLYETGPALEAVCSRVLCELGATAHEAEVAQEDFVLEFRGTKAIVEVKGITKSVSLDDLRQLGQYREDYRLKQEVEIKGVLLGNAWRLVHPAQRGNAFPANVQEYAEARGIALVTTCSLYDAFCRVREGKTDGADVLGKLLGGSGMTELS